VVDPSALGTTTDDRFRSICAQVASQMARLPIPGAVVGVLHDQQEWIAAFGATSVEHPLPVTDDTLFQIGSITKTYLATVVMRLVEMGQLDLDAPVRAYLPGLKLADESVAARVTLRHLLTHTGGWVGDYFNDFGPGDDALAKMVAKMAELPQLTPLGEVWSYNNSGFYLAGRVVEVVTGLSFEAAMQQLLFDPLGLKMTFFFAHEVITHRFAVGHEVVDGQALVARPWAIGRAAHPAGGIICTVKDLIRCARFHLGDGTTPAGVRLLSQESLARMQTPLFPSSGLNMSGLAWFITSAGQTQMIGHGGGTNGQKALLRIVPSEKFAVAVFANSDEGNTLTGEIVDLATQQYLGLAEPEAHPLDLPEDQLKTYVGQYDAAASFCEIVFRDGGLVLNVTPKGGFPTPDSPAPQPPPPLRLAFYAEDRAIVLDEPMKNARGEFLRNPDLSLAWLRLGLRVHKRVP
jgi:CubicO group peptidase (beta-lactamase class C family)